MHSLNPTQCAAVAGGLSATPPARPSGFRVAIPDPMPGMPYPGPGLDLL